MCTIKYSFFVVFCLFLISCSPTLKQNYYGYNGSVEKFEGIITINPIPIKKFSKTTKISIKNIYENKDLGSIGIKEILTVKELQGRFHVESNSDFMNYECLISKLNGEVIQGKVNRIDIDKLNFDGIDDELISEFGDMSDMFDFDKEETCGYLKKLFIKNDYGYGKKYDGLLNSLVRKMDFVEAEKLGLSSNDLKVNSVTLGRTYYNGGSCLLNGSSIKVHMSIDVDNQSMDMGIDVKGYSLISLSTGVPIVDNFILTFRFNETPVVSMEMATEITDIVFQ